MTLRARSVKRSNMLVPLRRASFFKRKAPLVAALWSLYPYGVYVNRWGLFRMQPYDNVYKKGIARCVCIGPTSVDFRTPIPRAWIISRFEPVNRPKTGDYPRSCFADQFHLHQLAGVAPARVGERACHTQANGQKRHDEHCTHKPAEHIDRVEGAHVIHRAIQIQARHHNDN